MTTSIKVSSRNGLDLTASTSVMCIPFFSLLVDKVCGSDCAVECLFPQVFMRMAANIYSSSHIIAGYDIERVYDEKTGQW